MDKKIFEVEISSGGPESYKTSAVLTMPCTQAELHDALQKPSFGALKPTASVKLHMVL